MCVCVRVYVWARVGEGRVSNQEMCTPSKEDGAFGYALIAFIKNQYAGNGDDKYDVL